MDRTDSNIEHGPCIILVDSQMGENIGAAARAMMNCAIDDLRLIRPRDGWPSEQAHAMSSGALDLMPDVKVFESTADALIDCHYVLATTARPRDMNKPVFNAKSAATEMHKRMLSGQKIGLMFGGERAGLENDDVALCDGIITVPLNPEFSSLNLAQGVLLSCYELYQQINNPERLIQGQENEMPVTHEKFEELFERLERELEAHHFFREGGQKPVMIRNLRNLLSRAQMSDQEARTFHGMISALTGKKKPPLSER